MSVEPSTKFSTLIEFEPVPNLIVDGSTVTLSKPSKNWVFVPPAERSAFLMVATAWVPLKTTPLRKTGSVTVPSMIRVLPEMPEMSPLISPPVSLTDSAFMPPPIVPPETST